VRTTPHKGLELKMVRTADPTKQGTNFECHRYTRTRTGATCGNSATYFDPHTGKE
jgi:hypothetical protein